MYKNKRMHMVEVMKKKREEQEKIKEYMETGAGKDLLDAARAKYEEVEKKVKAANHPFG